METTYYTLTAREIIVSGDAVAQAAGAPARQLVCVRRPAVAESAPAGNVIDLNAWKAARAEETQPEQGWYDGAEETPEQPAPAATAQPRRSREKTVLLGGELLATLSVIGAMALLMVRILAF